MSRLRRIAIAVRVGLLAAPVAGFIGVPGLAPASAVAQTTAGQTPPAARLRPPARDDAYVETAEGRRNRLDVRYYDPEGGPPALSLDEGLLDKPEEASSFDPDTRDFVLGAILVIVLGLAIWAVAALGGARATGFSTVSSGKRAGNAPLSPAAQRATETPLDLSAIEAMADRRAALIALGRAALARAAMANDLRLGRSWTYRDALRRIPRGWRGYPALASIARASEIAHFGGRPVDEMAFRQHLELARGLFGGRAGAAT
ncbi:MAG: hypothetical protein AAF677_17130 [Pseudomonadota bacterium]